MIKIYHPQKPKKLIENEQLWTVNLLELVNKYGGYDEIPDTEKKTALLHYKDKDFKDLIFGLTNSKCAFCESVIETVDHIHVEHFFPKSLYPKMAFKWTNLIPSCGICNGTKGAFDTKNEPFVNPMIHDPDDYFDFTDCRIKVSETAPDFVMAENTIEKCNLRRTILTREYSGLIVVLYEIEDAIKEELSHYSILSQNAAKLKILFKILACIENLIFISKPGESYAGFTRFMIRKSKIIKDAIALLNNNQIELGLIGKLKI